MFYRKRQLRYVKKISTFIIPITVNLFDWVDITYSLSNFYPNHSAKHALRVRIDGLDKYAPLDTVKPSSMSSGRGLSVRYDNTLYYTYKAQGMIGFNCTDSISDTYYNEQIKRTWKRTIYGVKVSFAMSNDFDLFVSSNNGSSWISIGTIPAGSYGITYKEPIEITYTASGDTSGSEPILPSGTFKFKVRSVLKTQTNIAKVSFRACAITGLMIGTQVYVELDHELTKGRLEYENEWIGLGAPWYASDSTFVLEEGDKSGLSQPLGDMTIGALYANLRINYIVNGQTYTICTCTYIPSLTIAIIAEKEVSFDEWLNDPIDIVTINADFVSGSGLKGISNIPYQYW